MQVCELHFHAEDFITTLSHQVEQTGRIIEVDRGRRQLKHNVVPSIFPNCPKYLSSKPTSSESPARKIARRESAALQEAIKKSLESRERRNKVSSYADFKTKLSGICNNNFWTVTISDECVRFLVIENNPSPYVKCSLTVLPDLSLSVVLNGVQLRSLPWGSAVPSRVFDTPTLSLLLEQLERHLSELPEMRKESKHAEVLRFINLLLEDVIADTSMPKEYCALLKFLSEQVDLLRAKSLSIARSYWCLPVFTQFLLMLYHFVRAASRVILPHPSTIWRICSSYRADPLIEQSPTHCLSYIRE